MSCSCTSEAPPDAVVVDIRLPPTHTDEGLRAALTIRQEHPDVGVLVLSQYVEVGLAVRLLADSAEGVGYLLKDRVGEVTEFVAAVRRVADGGSALDPDDRLDHAEAAPPLRSAGFADASRAGGARADGRRSLQRRVSPTRW